MKSEEEAGHECNINNMTQVEEYKSPGKNKDASTVNDSAYYILNEYEDEISDSDKNIEARKQPITDTHVCNTSVGTTSVYPAVIGVRIIGRGGRGITQGMIHGGKSIIISNVIRDVLTDSSKMIHKSDLFPLEPLKSQTLVIASQNKPTLSCNRNVRVLSEIVNSRIDHGKIGTPIVNKKIWSIYDNFSVRSDGCKADKLDTSVQRYLTNERNMAYLKIEEESPKSVFSRIVEESNSSKQMILENSTIIEPPKLLYFGHPPMETDNIRNRIDGIVDTIIDNSDGIWRRTARDDRMAHTHENIENISKKIAYRKHM